MQVRAAATADGRGAGLWRAHAQSNVGEALLHVVAPHTPNVKCTTRSRRRKHFTVIDLYRWWKDDKEAEMDAQCQDSAIRLSRSLSWRRLLLYETAAKKGAEGREVVPPQAGRKQTVGDNRKGNGGRNSSKR